MVRTMYRRCGSVYILLVFFCFLLVLLNLSPGVEGRKEKSSKNPATSPLSDNGTSPVPKVHELKCKDGLILPAWKPLDNLSNGDIIARGLIYFLALIYLFIGVSIIADRFMAAIEVITSKEKTVVIKKPNGETQEMSVRIWNETVSNLTLMALGSSAPEILLSIIEVYAQDYNAGDLGPGTIVGSAAFNMFVIIAICVWVIPSPEIKKIKHLRVFFVTMIWSVFAYIWLYAIICWISPGVIDVWEGLVTFLFFPATVGTAYIADKRLLMYKYLSKQYRLNRRGVVVGGEGDEQGDDLEMGPRKSMTNHVNQDGFKVFDEEANADVKEFEDNRREFIQILKDLRKKNPDASMEEIEMMAREEILNRGPKSRAFYRLQATKKLTGGSALVKRRVEKTEEKKEEEVEKKDPNIITFYFDPAHYTVMENVGQFAVTISRDGDLSHAVCVDFRTEDGSANSGTDYEGVEETLIFHAGESHKQVFITVIDDDVFEEDEHFYCRILEPRYLNAEGQMNNIPAPKNRPKLELAIPSTATVMILDDDHGGIFAFPEANYEISEAVGEYSLKVSRFSGARGKVYVPYKTVEGTAKAGKEFNMTEGELVFDNNEGSAELPIQILDCESYEKDAVFYVELSDPKREEDMEPEDPDLPKNDEVALLGKPRLGEIYKCQIRIKESKEFKNTVDKLFQKANTSVLMGASSWRDQFIEAITVSAGDDDDEGEEGDEDGEREEKMPSCSDYVMHFITLFWKVIFAFVPPTDYLDGWVCFVFSITGIGILTAFIGDFASALGCTIGLKDTVTAIGFVALGTSVPDLGGGWFCFVASIAMIGVCTGVVGDLASQFGCTVGLKDTVTAISFVALGTSIPDTFASKVAALNDKYADSSIGNVTGSNAVNVFLGIGIAWTIAACVHWKRGTVFLVEPGALAFSVTLFCISALICCLVMMIRRTISGGELGGPMKLKLPTTILFVGLWLFYVLMSSLEAYDVIEGF